MGQSERTQAVSNAFSASWSAMIASPNWWPAAPQVECARLRREASGISAALSSPAYVEALGSSLRRWGAFRGARFEQERLSGSLKSVSLLLARWEAVSILTLRVEDVHDLFELFDAVRDIKPTRRKWVATSKTLHHLLPDLIVPMDNQMTAPFLGRGSLPATFESSFLVESYSAFVDLARNRTYGVGARRVREASREVPYPVEGAIPQDCRVGLARVPDFAIAGFVRDHGRTELRLL